MDEISELAIIKVLVKHTKYNGAKTKIYTKFGNPRCNK